MKNILIPEHRILSRLKELAREIDRDFAGREPVLVCNLKGAFMVMADLVRFVTIPVRTDFVCFTSYNGAESSGSVQKRLDVSEDIAGKPVIIVEDIIDTGLTVRALTDSLKEHAPSGISVLSLLYRKGAKPRYGGFEIGDSFVYGYGLDYEGRYRQMRDVLILQNNEKD